MPVETQRPQAKTDIKADTGMAISPMDGRGLETVLETPKRRRGRQPAPPREGMAASESSIRLVNFLEEQGLHKKDFAEMIGVTLSYVYSLIDNTIPFSTRSTTLERIAVVMDLPAESFPEYRHSEEPQLFDPGIDFLKQRQKEMGLSNVQLLKRFPRNQRLDIVDMWRGALPLPIDWALLSNVCAVLDIPQAEVYAYWQSRVQQYLIAGGMDPLANIGLLTAMFDGIRTHLKLAP